jgi:hypothetical protein
MDTSLPNDEIEESAFKYDPERVLQPKWKWVWALVAACLLVMIVSIAGTLGVTRWLHATPAAEIEPLAKLNVLIAGTVDETALLLVDMHGASSQIKVASTTTDTLVVRDFTRGRFQASSAALSPVKDRLAYIREEDGHRTAVMVDLSNSNSAVVKEDDLRVSGAGTRIEPCSWSPVAWSPDGESFSFFGCGRTTSVLVVVQAETELTPVIIQKTETAQASPRQVFWLNDDSLLYTQFDPSTEETWVSRVSAKADAVPLSVYGK